jgi:hypothetical protein
MANVVERSYNGWQAHRDRRQINVEPMTVSGSAFPGGVKRGDVTTVLQYVAEQFNARVEALRPDWCWGYNYRQNRNANNLSCHASGTAIDCNAPAHPNGKRGTFSAAQVRTIRQILAECGGVVQWGGDFRGTPDEMHFEILGDASQVAGVARNLSTNSTISQEEDDMTPDESQMLKELHALVKVPNEGYSWGRAAHSQADLNGKTLEAIKAMLQGPDDRWNMLQAIMSYLPTVYAKAQEPGQPIDEAKIVAVINAAIPKGLEQRIIDELGKRIGASS